MRKFSVVQRRFFRLIDDDAGSAHNAPIFAKPRREPPRAAFDHAEMVQQKKRADHEKPAKQKRKEFPRASSQPKPNNRARADCAENRARVAGQIFCEKNSSRRANHQPDARLSRFLEKPHKTAASLMRKRRKSSGGVPFIVVERGSARFGKADVPPLIFPFVPSFPSASWARGGKNPASGLPNLANPWQICAHSPKILLKTAFVSIQGVISRLQAVITEIQTLIALVQCVVALVQATTGWVKATTT